MSTVSDDRAKSTVTEHLGITGWLRGPQFPREAKAIEFLSNPQITRDRTLEAVAQALLHLTAKEPLILFLDDLQWADHLSLALIHYIAKKCRNSRLLIVGTYRTEEVIPAKEEGPPPLQDTMLSMSREDLLFRIELNRLMRDDFPELLTSLLRSTIGDEFVERLYEVTEGNPLFTLETLNMLVDEGSLAEKEGRWMLTAPIERLGIPSKVQEVVIRRIARLGREERKLLDLAAVCGHSFRPDTLSRVLALDIVEVFQTLFEVEHRHRLIRSEDSMFEFTHHSIREVMYGALPGGLRKVYHLRTAGCLEQVLAEKISDGYITEIAHHYVEGGAPEKAFDYLVELGEKAIGIYANDQALDYLNNALEAAQKNPSLASNVNLFKMYMLRGRARLRLDEPPYLRARRDFDLMLQNATAIGDESIIAEAHHWSAQAYNPYFINENEREERMRHLTTALEMAKNSGKKSLEGRVLLAIGYTLYTDIDTREESPQWFREASKVSRETGDKTTEAISTRSLGTYHSHRGEFHRAKKYITRAIALREEVGGLPPAGMLFYLSIALTGLGEYNDAISTGKRCLQLSREYGFVDLETWILNTLGWIYHQLSDIELAIKYNNESLECARAHEKRTALGGVPYALSNLGMVYLTQRDYEKAEKHIEEAWSTRHLHGGRGPRLELRILQGRGEISLARGEHAQALKFIEDSLAMSEKLCFKKYTAKGLKLKAEAQAEMGDLREAIESMEKALNLAEQMGTPHLLWQIHHGLGLLLEKHGDPKKASEYHAEALTLIEATASKLDDLSLKNTLLTSPMAKTIHDANV
jgi:tetratricopeptide (TPR) repeat protein